MNHKIQYKLSENARNFFAGIFEELENRMITSERNEGAKNGCKKGGRGLAGQIDLERRIFICGGGRGGGGSLKHAQRPAGSVLSMPRAGTCQSKMGGLLLTKFSLGAGME